VSLQKVGIVVVVMREKTTKAKPAKAMPIPKGFVSDFVEWASGITDAPMEFLTGAALSCLSVAVGNRCSVNNRIYGNLWLLLVGPSSVARKTTSINLARMLCRHANLPMFPDRITPESFYESLAVNPEGLFTLSELSGWLGNINRSYARGLKADLTELYDGNHFERVRKTPKGELIKYTIEKPYICLLAASTQEWFEAAIKEDDSAGGFLPRFHFILGTPRPEYKIPPDMTTPFELIKKLRRIVCISGNIRISRDVSIREPTDYYLEWVDRFNERVRNYNLPHLPSYAERIKTSVFKLALLLEADSCANEGITSIEKWSLPSVQAACNLADYFLSTAYEVLNRMAFSDFERLVRKIADIIASSKRGITQRDLLRSAKVSKSVLLEAVEYLLETEAIEKESLSSGRGPKTILYRSRY
jgi:hypothetical protein